MTNQNIYPTVKANDLLARLKRVNNDFESKTDDIATNFDKDAEEFDRQEVELNKIDKSIANDIDTAVLEMLSKTE